MLKFRVKSLDGIDEKFHDLYKKVGDGYELAVDGIDPADELKEALRKEREDHKETKRKVKDIESKLEDDDRKKGEKDGEFETLYNKAIKKLEDTEKERDEIISKMHDRDISSRADGIARKLAAEDAGRAKVLSDYARRFAKHDGEKVTYEIDGIPVDEDRVAEHLSKEYPFLVDGSQASGSGGDGGNKGSGAANTPTIKRSEFDQMDHGDRKKFFNDGGKVVDD